MSKKQAKTEVLQQKFQPIRLNGFILGEKGATVERGAKPTHQDFQSTFDFVQRVKKFAGFWLVDLIRYADSRKDWAPVIDAIIDSEALTEKSVKQYRYLGKHMLPTEERVEGAEFGLHAKVAALPPDEQKQWLEKAVDHGWGQVELVDNLRAAERVKVVDGQAKLQGMYRIIYADPPWQYGDSGATVDGSLGKAERHYPTMTIEQLCALPVKAHAMPDSLLAMWVTAPLLLQNPGPREVLEAWGFTYKTNYVWDKVLGMRGHYSHVTHEHLVIATRGSCLMDVPTPQPKSVQTINRKNLQHSEKPKEFRELIEKHWNRGPYLELFGRKRVSGWDVFGNDARLWTRSGPPAPKQTIEDKDIPF